MLGSLNLLTFLQQPRKRYGGDTFLGSISVGPMLLRQVVKEALENNQFSQLGGRKIASGTYDNCESFERIPEKRAVWLLEIYKPL
jgi:hypothetical protein